MKASANRLSNAIHMAVLYGVSLVMMTGCPGTIELGTGSGSSRCGDGQVDSTEQCDPPNGTSCDDSCQFIGLADCGNGIINADEECDGGFHCTHCTCVVNFEPTVPPSLNCQPTPPDEYLLVRPLDGVVVLYDLTLWDTRPYLGVSTVSTWRASDLIEDLVHIGPGSFESMPHIGPGSPFTLHNLRTGEFVGANYLGMGSRATVSALLAQNSGDRLVSINDGTTWEIASRDEAGSRVWQVGDEVVFYRPLGNVINLRTGRVMRLSLR